MAQAFSILDAVAGESSPSTAGAAPPALAHVTDALRAAPVGSWRRKLLDRIESVHDVDDPSKPFLLALNQDPELGALIAKASGAGMPSEAVAQVVAKITNRAILSVRAIDLENDGQEVTGATVYGQPIDLPVNTLGKRVELGKTPLQMKAIECGEWRITVVDSSGLEVRFSELRFLASPGENLGRRVAFLRTTSEVIEGMALREPCVARVGTPPDAEASQLDSPDSTTPVAKLWIDRCEVTCAEYSKFYLDLLDHPAWFDGRMPIHRPRVLAADGSCPPNLVRRAIVDVAWEEASLYANWAGKRLPTEVEWERVARGDENENRKYPWGSTFDAARINTELSVGTHPLVPVMFHGRMGYRMPDARHEDLIGAEVDATAYDSGSTPESSGTRVLRMADNVQEFVEDLFFARATGATTAPMIGATVTRVVKGSSWIFASEDATINWRRNSVTTSFGIRDVGLRCLKTAAPMVEPR
jgi:formylglycine-generating enzyme required for sulfatase activity